MSKSRLSIAMLLFSQWLSVVQAAPAPIPKIEPVPDNGNLPLNSAMYAMSLDYGELARYGYVEKEFYFSGTASTREQETTAILKADLPYVSRMVVRMPASPKAFSGNVIMEPFHAVFEKTDIWQQTHRYITERGDAWVGYTVHGYHLDMEPDNGYFLGGVPMLKAYDPVRYGRLNLEPDLRPGTIPPPTPLPPQSLDLTAQVGALLKSNDVQSPLSSYAVKRVFLTGAGINGDVIAVWLSTGQHDAWTTPQGGQIFDGYLYGVQFRFPPPPPKNAAVVLYRDIAGYARAAESGWIDKAPDTPNYKVYNFIGMSHIGAVNNPWAESPLMQINAVLPQPEATMPALPWVIDNYGGCTNVNDDPINLALGALLVRLEDNRMKGTPLPEAPLPALLPDDPGATIWDKSGRGDELKDKKVAKLKLDPVSGMVVGGVQMPWIAVPIAAYPLPTPFVPGGGPGGPPKMAKPTPTDAWPRASMFEAKLPHKPGPGFCPIYHPRIPFDAATLRKLYGSYDAYAAKFEAAKVEAVRKGWLLKQDAATLRPRARPSDFQ